MIGPLEPLVLAEVGGQGDPVAGAGVAPRQRPAAALAVDPEALRGQVGDVDRRLAVPHLPHVEVSAHAVPGQRQPEPPEQVVARRLHQPLALDDALPSDSYPVLPA